MARVSIEEIRRINKEHGYHFFDREAMHFFNSRLPRYGYHEGNKYYFVTSEQFDGRDTNGNYYQEPRKYTVRKMSENGNMEEQEEFQKHQTYKAAEKELKKVAGIKEEKRIRNRG